MNLYIATAISVSIFHGIFATSVFNVPTKGMSFAWKVHQFWLNFLGSIIGWCALWAVYHNVSPCLIAACASEYGWPDVGLFLLAFLGVTGYIPFTVIGLASGINQFAIKAMDLVK